MSNSQLVVLQWLKDDYETTESVIESIYNLHVETAPSDFKTCLMTLFRRLVRQQETEVIAAFTDWALRIERSEQE